MLQKIQLRLKTQKSIDTITEAYDKFPLDKIVLAWTGGKDSTLLLWMVKEISDKKKVSFTKIMFINEGDVFEEIQLFVKKLSKKWKFDYEVVQNDDVLKQVKKLGDKVIVAKLNKRNKDELKKLGFKEKSFPFEPESYVGNHLMKTVPMNLYLEKYGIKALITGIRRDEQEARANETYFSIRKNPDHTRVHPILHLREKDVWGVTFLNKIPYVDLYEKGYRSLGAKSSTVKPSSTPAWKQDLKNTTERVGRRQDKEKIMGKLRKLGYM